MVNGLRQNMRLLTTGFLQVFFVAINTYFIANKFYLGCLVCGFLISFIWSFNVKKVAFGDMKDRIIYSVGASLGCVVGVYVSSLIIG